MIVKRVLFLIVIVIFISINCISMETRKPNILIINSAHKGYTFTDRIISGMEAYYRKGPIKKANIYNEYLDFMRVPPEEIRLELLAKYISQKYKNVKMNLILVTDDGALDFVLRYRNLFNPKIPVVHCGITPERKESLKKENNVCGLFFDFDFGVNLNLADKIFPDRSHYIVLHDSSLLGISISKTFKALEKNFRNKTFTYISGYSLDEVADYINKNSGKSVIFPTIYNSDRFGNDFNTEEFTNLLASKIDEPMFGFLDYQSNRGILGGQLYIGFKSGELASKIGDKLMTTGQIPVSLLDSDINLNTIFSYEQLERYNINPETLPDKVIIANRPLTYFEKYRRVLVPYVILIVSLLIFSVILLISIKKRKRISRELQKSEERFRLLTSNAKDIIFRFDFFPKEGFSYISPSIKTILGFEPEPIYNDHTILAKYLHPDSLNIFFSLSDGSFDFSKNIELQWLLPDGKTIWTEEKYQPIYDENKKLIAFEGVSRDITERKIAAELLRESQERLNFVLEGSRDGIWDWNIVTGEIITDERWLEILGYSVGEVITNYEFWRSSVHPDDLKTTLQLLERNLTGESDNYETEYRMKTKSGNYVWILDRGKVVNFDESGKAIRMTGTHTDVTEKRKNESELLKMQKLESLGVLAGGIAHDFNNILTSILGNITLAKLLLKSSKDLDKISSLLHNSEKSTYRAKELTQKLLAFSKGGNPVKKIIKADRIVSESISSITQPEITTEVKLLSSPWSIEVDPDQIKQVLVSILTNAAESMNNKGLIKVIVRNYRVNHRYVLNPVLSKDYYLRIDIIDQGCGIPTENLEKVFDPYFTTKPRSGGLGLASAFAIIKNHFGHISISSKVGKGTTVTIYIPAIPEIEKIKTDSSRKILSLKPKILVMDDDDFIRDLLSEALTSFGYDVELTVDGDETINKYNESLDNGAPYDLIIMDLTIPGGKGGKDTIIELKAIDPDVNAIVSSGYSNDPILSNFEEYGFKGIISKPYNMDILKETIENIIGKKL